MKKTNYSMKLFLFRTFASLIVFVLIILTLCISINFSKTIRKTSYEKYESIFQQSSQQLSNSFYNIATTAAVLNNSPELISAVNLSLHGSTQYTRLQNETLVQKLLTSASYYSAYVKNICIYKEQKTFFMHDSDLSLTPSQIENQPWFHIMYDQNKDHLIVPYGKDNYLFIQFFQKTLHESSPGLLLFVLDNQLLENCLKNIASKNEAIICAYDTNQTLLYTNLSDKSDFLKNHLNELATTTSGEKLSLDKTSYLLIKETNAFADWTLVSLVPSVFALQSLIPLYLKIVPLVLLILFFSIYLSFILSRYITKPLEPLLQSMQLSSKGNFAFELYSTKISEINTLISGYDNMLHKISRLIQQIQQIEKEKRKTELEILQAQISPHFIYNTLNSIRWLALMENSPKIAEIISSFSTLLQIINKHPTEFITVEEELTEVSCYLDIMKFRYNTTLEVLWEIEEQTRSYKTLKLIIQPLVENCFYHAFSSSEYTGKIIIRCFQKEHTLFIQVEDNGSGFSYDSNSIPISASDGHHNIGLANIHNRLQLWFGEEYGLALTSTPGYGTIVTLSQPILLQEKEESHDTNIDCRR